MSTNVDPLALIRPMAESIMTMATVVAMTKTVTAMSGASAFGGFAASQSAKEELEALNVQISRLGFALEKQRDVVAGHREHMRKLMLEYKVYIMPSEVELKSKYPKLYYTNRYLKDSGRDLERMELNMMFKQKRRKELMTALGMREEEEPRHVRYPATKKFIPPIERERRYQ